MNPTDDIFDVTLQRLIGAFEENAVVQDEQAAERTSDGEPFVAQRHVGQAQAYRAAASEVRGALTRYREANPGGIAILVPQDEEVTLGMASALKLSDITNYLTATGWRRSSRGAAFWEHPGGYEVLVPPRDGFGDAPRRIRETLRCLAALEGRPARDIARDIAQGARPAGERS